MLFPVLYTNNWPFFLLEPLFDYSRCYFMLHFNIDVSTKEQCITLQRIHLNNLSFQFAHVAQFTLTFYA